MAEASHSSPRHVSLTLKTPPLHLFDSAVPLSLTLTPSLTLRLRSTAHLQTYLTDPARLHLLRSPGLVLNLTLTHNAAPAPEHVLSTWARCIASSEIWKQLAYTAALSIPSSTAAQISLHRSSHAESVLPSILPDETASVRSVDMVFEFFSNGHGTGEEPTVKVGAADMLPLTDTALRSFWGDKVSTLAPIVGKPGVLPGVDKRVGPLEVIAEILGRRNPASFAVDNEGVEELQQESTVTEHTEQEKLENGGDNEGERAEVHDGSVKAQLWRVLLRNAKGSGALKPLRMPEEQGEESEREDIISDGESHGVHQKQDADSAEWDKMFSHSSDNTSDAEWERMFYDNSSEGQSSDGDKEWGKFFDMLDDGEDAGSAGDDAEWERMFANGGGTDEGSAEEMLEDSE